MMILRTSAPSPFGRKAVIAASILGLSRELTIEPADTSNPADTLRQQNPIGKIPILLIEDETAIYDSPVILEYLDHRAGGGRIIPREMKARFSALTLQALCDGILDALLLQVYEIRFRPEERREAKWLEYQVEKVSRGLSVLERNPPVIDTVPSVGQITLACTLGYQDLRFQGRWRNSYPRLVAWLDDFAGLVPAFAETKVNP